MTDAALGIVISSLERVETENPLVLTKCVVRHARPAAEWLLQCVIFSLFPACADFLLTGNTHEISGGLWICLQRERSDSIALSEISAGGGNWVAKSGRRTSVRNSGRDEFKQAY